MVLYQVYTFYWATMMPGTGPVTCQIAEESFQKFSLKKMQNGILMLQFQLFCQFGVVYHASQCFECKVLHITWVLVEGKKYKSWPNWSGHIHILLYIINKSFFTLLSMKTD